MPGKAVRSAAVPGWITPLILTIFVFVYGLSLFSPALFDDADATHAEVAREMYASGDYVTLHIDGVRYLEKAPFMYWLVAASYKTFGISEFSTRLPIVFGVLALIILAMSWTTHAFGALAGRYAGLFVVTSFGLYLFSRILIPEALLSFFLALSFYGFLRAQDSQGPAAKKWWYTVYASLALAVLTKGLVALVFFVGTTIVFLLLTGDWRRWREFHLFGGSVLFLAVAMPWHILAGLRNHGFFWFYFVNEHVLRFLGKRYPRDYNKMPALAYWAAHVVWLFPWSLFLPLVVRDLLRKLKDGSMLRSACFADRTFLLCAIWASLVLLFFSVSTNQEYYTVPAYLPILILLAGSVSKMMDLGKEFERNNHWYPAAVAIFAGFSFLGSMMLLAGLWRSRNLPFVSDIGNLLVERGVGNYTLSTSHFFDLTTRSFAALRLPAGVAMAALLMGAISVSTLKLKRMWSAGLIAIALTCAAFLFAAHLAMVRFEPYLSSRALAKVALQESRPSDHIFMYGDQSYGSSFIFYLGREIDIVDGRSTSLEFGSRFADAPKIFLNDSDLLRLWRSDQRQVLFVPDEKRRYIEGFLPQPRFLIADVSGKQLYTNRRD